VRVVVAGVGLAGVKVAQGLRDGGFEGEVVLLGEETELPYDRPPLTKQVLRREREPFFLLPPDHALDLRLGVAVEGLDLAGGAVRTSRGDLAFDQLVIATGASPRRLPGSPGRALRTLADCRSLSERLRPGATLGVVGAGLIGCEVAASARAMDVDVQVVDLLSAPLVRLLGEEVSARLKELHLARGVRFHLGSGVAEATPTSLTLANGVAVEVDLLLEAMGVVPTTAWLDGSGLQVSDGVVCDEYGMAAEGVWAVGDCARWSDGVGGHVRHEHWTSATEQAAIVAAAILGNREPAVRVPYWWSDQYDVKLQGLGAFSASDEVEWLTVGPRQRPLALYSYAGYLTGAVGFSAGAAVMGLRDAIIERRAVDQVRESLTVG
jgi:3-phenylpropionate/trans-cinnamate dioxygenase ferredoxin reductase subunit